MEISSCTQIPLLAHQVEMTVAECFLTSYVRAHFCKVPTLRVSHMRDILTLFDLEQCVHDPTHKSGHVIDWVLQRQSNPLLHSVGVELSLIHI